MSGHLQEREKAQEHKESDNTNENEGTCKEPVPHQVSEAMQTCPQIEGRFRERELRLTQGKLDGSRPKVHIRETFCQKNLDGLLRATVKEITQNRHITQKLLH